MLNDIVERLRENRPKMPTRDRYEAADLIEQKMWQPIETAPKDGSLIVLADYSGFRERGSDGMWIATGCWNAAENELENGRWWDRTEYLYTPTHWMPLPSPPTLTK